MKFFIDPHSHRYDNNNFFNLNDPFLNRDDGLVPFVKLKQSLELEGFTVSTFDKALLLPPKEIENSYYISFGRERSPELLKNLNLNLYAYLIMEPPLIDNKPYKKLPLLTALFKNVFLHNTNGNSYSLKKVDQKKLQKLFWPQPHIKVIESFWANQNRKCEVVMINGHHKPKAFKDKERYSERIKWSVNLNKYIPVSIYGRGWDRILSRSSAWPLFIINYLNIKKIYKGPCESKFQVMSLFDFALCFENLSMEGYITEKIFDCFYSGIIPIYWGGDDINNWIPSNSFIDIRNYKDPEDLSHYLKSLTQDEKIELKENGRKFIESEQAEPYYDLYKSLHLNKKPWLKNNDKSN